MNDLGLTMVIFVFANIVGILGYLVYHFFYRKKKPDSLEAEIDKLQDEVYT